MADDKSDKKSHRTFIGNTPDGDPIVKDESTGQKLILVAAEKVEEFDKLIKERKKEKEDFEKLGKEKGNNMADENTGKLETKIAKLEAKLANDEKAKYDKFLEGLAQKVDSVCTEVGGCRKDIGELKSKIDRDKERVEKDSKETCVGLDCIKKDLKAGQDKLSKLEKLDQLDKLDLYDCPECNKKIVPLYPEPSNYCPHCGKPAQWLGDDGKPLKGWNPPWKK